MLTVKDLHKSYQVGKTTYEVLKGVSLTVEKGEFVAVMGPSGSGKTTLLNCISCYIPIDSGEIMLGDRQLANLSEDALAKVRNRQLGFVFQAFNLLPEYTIRDNILLPLMLDKKAVDEAYLKFLTERLGLADLLHRQPGQLSGGQQQRAAIARALIVHPAVVLADEPTGNLDRKNSEEVFSLIRAVAAEQHQTVVYVTHDPDLAQAADRILEMEDGEIRLDSI